MKFYIWPGCIHISLWLFFSFFFIQILLSTYQITKGTYNYSVAFGMLTTLKNLFKYLKIKSLVTISTHCTLKNEKKIKLNFGNAYNFGKVIFDYNEIVEDNRIWMSVIFSNSISK